MAAHPFGPIEKFLLGTYYKKDIANQHPKWCKIGFNRIKSVTVPNERSDPTLALSGGDLFCWSPANGKRYVPDIRVTPGNRLCEQVDLLSRGLGYRITFTRPNVKSYHNGTLHLLDWFGERVLAEVCLNKQDWSDQYYWQIVQYLSKYKQVSLEFTIEHTKIITDQKDELVFLRCHSKQSSIVPQK